MDSATRTAYIDRDNDITIDSNGNVYVIGYTVGGLDGNSSAGGFYLFAVI